MFGATQVINSVLHEKMKFFIKDFFSKCYQIRSQWSHLLKKSLMENFIVCAVHSSSCIAFPFYDNLILKLFQRTSDCLDKGYIFNGRLDLKLEVQHWHLKIK